MDLEELAARVLERYDCDESTAVRIAGMAADYTEEMETDHTAEDWLSFMLESEQERAVLAWNWAIGYVDPSHWDEGTPYKIDP